MAGILSKYQIFISYRRESGACLLIFPLNEEVSSLEMTEAGLVFYGTESGNVGFLDLVKK